MVALISFLENMISIKKLSILVLIVILIFFIKWIIWKRIPYDYLILQGEPNWGPRHTKLRKKKLDGIKKINDNMVKSCYNYCFDNGLDYFYVKNTQHGVNTENECFCYDNNISWKTDDSTYSSVTDANNVLGNTWFGLRKKGEFKKKYPICTKSALTDSQSLVYKEGTSKKDIDDKVLRCYETGSVNFSNKFFNSNLSDARNKDTDFLCTMELAEKPCPMGTDGIIKKPEGPNIKKCASEYWCNKRNGNSWEVNYVNENNSTPAFPCNNRSTSKHYPNV
tara:strand:- start:401 stop:1237 length:837 start_codon:yes stop_codon:yes gene_type:complete